MYTPLKKWRGYAAREGRREVRGTVITIHGINTTGPWQKNYGPTFFDHCIRAHHVDYGYRTVSFFLRRRHLIKKAKEEFIRQYRLVTASVPDCLPGVIAHSFGTLVVGRLLLENPSIQIGACILAGSILAVDFDWKTIFDRGQCACVLNVVAGEDFWVRWGSRLRIFGVGKSGISGFSLEHPALMNKRYPYSGHSDLLDERMCEKEWIPLIVEHGIAKSRGV